MPTYSAFILTREFPYETGHSHPTLGWRTIRSEPKWEPPFLTVKVENILCLCELRGSSSCCSSTHLFCPHLWPCPPPAFVGCDGSVSLPGHLSSLAVGLPKKTRQSWKTGSVHFCSCSNPSLSLVSSVNCGSSHKLGCGCTSSLNPGNLWGSRQPLPGDQRWNRLLEQLHENSRAPLVLLAVPSWGPACRGLRVTV